MIDCQWGYTFSFCDREEAWVYTLNRNSHLLEVIIIFWLDLEIWKLIMVAFAWMDVC